METKLFYRVANHETQQGLWYDFKGNFTGFIHDKFNFCTNNKLPMPYDPNIVGWLSATETLDELFNWLLKRILRNSKNTVIQLHFTRLLNTNIIITIGLLNRIIQGW